MFNGGSNIISNGKIVIDEVHDCPNCRSQNTYKYSTDEINFELTKLINDCLYDFEQQLINEGNG